MRKLKEKLKGSNHPVIRLMKRIKWVAITLWKGRKEPFLKCAFKLGFLPAKPLDIIRNNDLDKKYVTVSLTSYGRRIHKSVHIAITSLMRQTRKPDRIVLWLDRDEMTEGVLPKNLKKLINLGLTVRFTDDLKSYKKLIPALEEYPYDILILADDDLWYNPHLIENLLDGHKEYPGCVITSRAFRIKGSRNSIFPYNKWEIDIKGKGRNIFPNSGSGTLLTKDMLYKDVSDKSLFLTLAPTADDVWLYFMAIMNGTELATIDAKKRSYTSFESIYQNLHRDSNLEMINCMGKANDRQIRDIMAHYKLTAKQILEK